MANVLSLFSGAGGLDVGFIKADFNIVASVELEETFCKTLLANHGTYFSESHQVICEDLTQFDPRKFNFGAIDFIIGGPPCQSFSAAGRRAGGVNGINDHRGTLFSHYCRLIQYYKPQGFLFENVRGMIQANHGSDWNVVKTALEGLGYAISYRTLDAADYGVPQHRERLIIVGLKDKKFRFPRPTCGPDSLGNNKYVGAWESIKDLDDPNEIVPPYGGKYGELLPEIPPGMNYLHFTPEMGHPRPRFAWRSKFSNFLYKANPDLPVKTIVASQSRYDGPFHWKNRKFTIPEFKRLQTFPDDYIIEGPKAIVIKQIGNSVPPRFAEAIAKAIMNQVFNPSAFPGLPLLEESDQLSFDKNKRLKANQTRTLKLSKVNPGQTTLLNISAQFEEGGKEKANEAGVAHRVVRWAYTSPRKRTIENEGHAIKKFEVTTECNAKAWNIQVSELTNAEKRKNVATLKLKFTHPIDNGYNEIICVFAGSTFWDIYAAWDAINDVITSTTAYSSIKDLYGHFTEPHPKFKLNVDIDSSSAEDISIFLKTVANFRYLGETHPLEDLVKMFNHQGNPLDLVKRLRAIRYDVRVNNTNKTILEGRFRCCYPFPNAIDELSNVTWTDSKND